MLVMALMVGQRGLNILAYRQLLDKWPFALLRPNLSGDAISYRKRQLPDSLYPVTFPRKKLGNLSKYVIYFTYTEWQSQPEKAWKICRQLVMHSRTSVRPVRRVHVMPWATPIRRIGSTRVNVKGEENPADSGGRRT
jgi:hypothetical protein